MKRETQEKFHQLLTAMAQAYGITDPRQQFAATVPMAQTLNDKIQATSEFLGRISIIPVTDIKGEVVTMTIPGSVAKRTNVSPTNPRQPTMAGTPNGRQYECSPTEFDVGIAYALLDAWARYPDFASRYMNAIYKRIALDRIMIGWRGTSVAAATDREANPQLQDVNKGWIFDLLTNKPANFITQGATADVIKLGANGDYQNLNQLVYDVGSLIPDENRTGGEVAIIGRGLVSTDMNKILAEHGEKPSEMAHVTILAKSYGGYPSVMVPGFPQNGVMVTDPKNLQIYLQDSSLRRRSADEPQFNRVVDYISQNESYMIGDLDAVAAIKAENVQFV